ncbi:MAG: branched-chain amino acid ABC transporter permease [Firmicutes bacterium]|nr:branched-chain amino acid ABC transporter permease [Bacillota bacterium]
MKKERTLPSFGTSLRQKLTWLATGLVGLLLLAVNIGVYRGTIDFYFSGVLVVAWINVILAVSLNLINGFTGQFSLGHAGFMAVGAYVSSLLTIHLNWPFPVVLMIAALVAAVLGFVIGLPTLRLRGDYLAIATLGFGEIVRVVLLNLDITGGPRGLGGIFPKTTFFSAELVAVLTIVVIGNIIRSSHGRAFIAVREDEIAAEAMGIDTTVYKVLAFTIGAAFAGVAGGLFAHHQMFIDPRSFTFQRSIEILVMVVLGGLGSITGSIIAAIVLTILPEALRGMAEYRMIVYAILLIGLMLVRPQGLFGTRELRDFLGIERVRWVKAQQPAAGVLKSHGGDGR